MRGGGKGGEEKGGKERGGREAEEEEASFPSRKYLRNIQKWGEGGSILI